MEKEDKVFLVEKEDKELKRFEVDIIFNFEEGRVELHSNQVGVNSSFWERGAAYSSFLGERS